MNWSIIVSIAAIVSALAVAVTTLFVLLQLRRMRLSQDVATALTLYDRSTTPEMLESAAWVKSQMPDDFSYENYCQDYDARQKLERLWYYFEFLGVLVNRGHIGEDIIFDQQGTFISGIWDKSEKLIKARRLDRKSPQYMENFEIMRNRFVEWAAAHPPKLAPQKTRKTYVYYENEYRRPAQ